MREIIKTVSLPVDGTPMDFRLTKLDAFSGASLLRLLASLPEQHPSHGVIPTEAEGEEPMTACGRNLIGSELKRSKRAVQWTVAPTELADILSAVSGIQNSE